MQYTIHRRSQHAKGSGPFHGPDTYIAVTIAPDGVDVPHYLNRAVLTKLGITILYFGEGYAEHTGPRSALGRAMKAAQEFIEAEKANAPRAMTPDERYEANYAYSKLAGSF